LHRVRQRIAFPFESGLICVQLLNIKLMYGYSFDNFFGLMQRVAEEKVRSSFVVP
jgi:hypothetical protein